MLIFLYIVTVLVISSNEAARILAVFPAPSISHQVTFRPLTNELVRRGHEVVVITTDPEYPKGKAPPNMTEINVHDESYGIWSKHIESFSKGESDFIAQMGHVLDLIHFAVENYFHNEEILNLINDKSKKYDLLLVEAMAKPALIFSHIFKIPVIQVSSFGASFDSYSIIGAPTHPLLYTTFTRWKVNNLTAWDKIVQVYEQVKLDRLMLAQDDKDSAMLKKYFGDDTPTLNELVDRVDMQFLNINPMFEGIRPVPPNVIYTGGLHQKPGKELPKDLQSYLDSSKNGVIYLSFGTNVIPSLLPPERLQAIVKVFSELPYNVLWKYDKDELPRKSDNIKIDKWFPQADLLKHPNVKAFITQGGLQSTDEAITAGVPLIGVPILGDQWFNTERYEALQIGVKVDIETLEYDNFKKAVQTVIGDESYRRNIRRLRDLMQDTPMTPLERAIWWTEYVIRNGGAKHLRSPAANITWAEYLELKLVFTVLTGLFISITLILIALYYVYIRVLGLASDVSSKKKKA